MLRLTHFRLCPLSRSIRLALAEQDREVELAEERAWEWPESLLQLNPAGELPVLQLDDGGAVCGTYAIVELLSEEEPEQRLGRSQFPLFPGSREGQPHGIERTLEAAHGDGPQPVVLIHHLALLDSLRQRS